MPLEQQDSLDRTRLIEAAKQLRSILDKKEVVELKELDPLEQAKFNDQLADTSLKKLYARGFIGILVIQLLAMNVIFIAAGLDKLHFQDPTHLNLFMGGTLAEVFGVVLVIARYLFSKK